MSTPLQSNPRHKTITVKVGAICVGSDHPVVVQSMTNTDTADINATVRQVAQLAEAGSELVRITVNSDEAAAAVATIREQLDAQGVGSSINWRLSFQRPQTAE